MPSSLRIPAAGFLVALLAFPVLRIAAQDAQTNDPPAGTIIIEQTSDVEAVGSWTLLQPSHESFQRTDAKMTVSNMRPGQYSFFAVAPEGTTAHAEVLLGDDAIVTAEAPQISFELQDKMTLTVKIHYSLTIYGKVGVGSDPFGILFELRGPNGMKRTGITPVEFSPSPVGNYSVTYKPKGCPQPPAQSGLLQKEDRVNFMIKIVCETFEPEITEEKATTVVTELGGKTTIFDDVPSDAWFAPYVATIVGRGIMTGYTDGAGASIGKFGPGDPVTIAQLAKIAHTAMKFSADDVTTAPVNPLARGQWFTRYIASAEERGWSVYVDGTVDPHRPAIRGEVVATLLQVLDIPVKWPQGDKFTDVLRKTPYAGAIETAAAEGIVAGSTDANGSATGLFHPADPIARAEIAKILILIREKYQGRSSSSN